MPTKIVNLKYEPYDVYIGRGPKYETPFKIGIDGTRNEIIKKYESWIINQKELMDSLSELDDKTIGCYCKPLPCHGDVLKKLIEINKLVSFE